MERWASNTLRVLGIVVTSIILVLGSLLLLLLSLCAWGGGLEGGGGHRDQAVGYLIGLAALLVVSIFVIAKLAKGIAHSTGLTTVAGPEASTVPQAETTLHISPASENAIRRLIYAIVAVIVVSAFHSFLNGYWTTLSGTPHIYGLALIARLILFICYQAPYGILLVTLMRSTDRRVFAYAFAVPIVMIIFNLFSLPVLLSYYFRSPVQLILLAVSLGLDGLVLWLAWRASESIGHRHEATSLVVAGITTFVYFGILQYLVAAALMRILWR